MILDDYSQINFPGPRNIFEYAKAVEAVTTTKKDNLILNVDGAYGALLCDMWLILGYTNVEINKMLKDGVLTAIFVFGRSIGTIGHILDEKRQDSPLYRHDLNDIWYDLE